VVSEDGKRIFENFLSLGILRGFQFVIPLVTLPYLVRTIGIDNFGLVNFALSLGAYFGAIIQFGFGITATREIARHRTDEIQLGKIYSATVCATVLLALASAFLFFLIVLSFEKLNSQLCLYLFTLAFIVCQNLFPVWLFQGLEKMKYISFLMLGANLFYLISLLYFVKEQDDYLLVPLLSAISSFVSLMAAFFLINTKFNIKFITPDRREVINIYKKGYHAFISQFAPTLYNNSAIFILGIFTNNSTVGLYASATKLIDAVVSLAYVLSNAFLPYLSRNINKHKIFQRIMLTSGAVLTLVIFFMAECIVNFLFGADNFEVAFYIQWLAISVFLVFSIMTYGTNYLMLIGEDRIVRNIALYTSMISFGFALIVIPLWSIWGAIATLVGARAAMASIQFWFYVKHKNKFKY